MTPKHHPDDAVLVDYVAGAMRPAFAVVVAAHLEACPHCRASVRELEALGGAMLGDMPDEVMSDEALDRVMAGIERPIADTPAAPRPTPDRVPFGREIWLGPGMGIRKARLPGGDLLYQLRLPKGLTTIPHGHRGVEYTTVLKGAFQDGTGVFAAGDFAEMTDAVDHQPSVTPEGECICLIASQQPMAVRTLMGRIVHMLTGA